MADGERKIKPLYIVLGIVVLVFGGAMLAVTLSGREPVVVPDVTPRPGATIQTPVPTSGADPQAVAPGASPVPTPATEVFEIFEGRDPFRPLVFEGSPGTAPIPPVSGTVTPAPTSGGGSAPAPTPVPARNGVQVEVLSVAQDSS